MWLCHSYEWNIHIFHMSQMHLIRMYSIIWLTTAYFADWWKCKRDIESINVLQWTLPVVMSWQKVKVRSCNCGTFLFNSSILLHSSFDSLSKLLCSHICHLCNYFTCTSFARAVCRNYEQHSKVDKSTVKDTESKTMIAIK